MEHSAPLPKKLGLLADSHSDLQGLESAVRLLRRRGAEGLVHLGDICDSLRLDLLGAFIDLIRRYRILAVKGNNDFSLENLLLGRPPELWRGTEPLLSFLQTLPMTIEWGSFCFAHSLPFDFLRAFYEPIDVGTVQRAQEVFLLTPHRVLFCGHSHRSVLFRARGARVSRETVPANRRVHLDPGDRYIHVVGAVSEGECALFDTETWVLERIGLPRAGA